MFSINYLVIVGLLLLLLVGSQWWLRHARGVARPGPAVRLLERRALTQHTALLRASLDGREVWLVESSRHVTVLRPAETTVAVVPAGEPVPSPGAGDLLADGA